MESSVKQKNTSSLCKARRQELVNAIKQESGSSIGAVLLLAAFESGAKVFKQDSAFFYYTGITEPGLALMIDLTGDTTLFVPQFKTARGQWLHEHITVKDVPAQWGVDAICALGDASQGYQIVPDASSETFNKLHAAVQRVVDAHGVLYTCIPGTPLYPYAFGGQQLVMAQLQETISGLKSSLVDVMPFIARQRQIKDMHEVEAMYRAVEITCMAQEAAAQAITDKVLECEVQASLEYIFTASGASTAFASVVGGGANSTILHYATNAAELHAGDVVVVDIGAQYNGYCADLTRTYPVSGTFSRRQKEVYEVVLAAQEYIARIAKPGYWLNNADFPDKSLNHLVQRFIEQKGFGEYIVHGIGHFIGLDVHDVADTTQPLKEGMVFTIEPGIYIPKERLGVRIEDNYWVVKDGVVCLSEQLPKKPEEVEAFMRGEYQHEGDFNEEDGDECDEDCACSDVCGHHECGEC